MQMCHLRLMRTVMVARSCGAYCVTGSGTWLCVLPRKPCVRSLFRIAAQASDPDPAASVVSGEGIHRVDYGGASNTVLLEVRDKFGNTSRGCPLQKDPWTFMHNCCLLMKTARRLTALAMPTHVLAKRIGAGYFELSFSFPGKSPLKSKSRGMLQVFLNGSEVKGSPFYPELNVAARVESLCTQADAHPCSK